MRASFIMVFSLATSILANHASLQPRSGICSVAGIPLCCTTDVFGIVDLDCSSPPSIPANATDFSLICQTIGRIDRCCEVLVGSVGIFCSTP
ncbi:hypothetical protein OIDMADRAFT_19353 [Oidiodendron maius Zn]|uniref:Hydrophobin n=1 Tax=Oidiodendron maius (strain Zn) TaxID=913774 RepID=A0A0C3DDP7_OIDMZ|nr:hypothetical protein OIDMADRAFT_19353 [Oidiodendron maius Zn]